MNALFTIKQSLWGFPLFLLYFVTLGALVHVAVRIYTWITPYDEIAMKRAGNMTAAIILGGVLIGITIPTAAAIFFSKSLLDAVIWTVVAVMVQLLMYTYIMWRHPEAREKIERDVPSVGVWFAAVSISSGILQAACMSY